MGPTSKKPLTFPGGGGGGMTNKLHDRACVCRINVLSENKAVQDTHLHVHTVSGRPEYEQKSCISKQL